MYQVSFKKYISNLQLKHIVGTYMHTVIAIAYTGNDVYLAYGLMCFIKKKN